MARKKTSRRNRKRSASSTASPSKRGRARGKSDANQAVADSHVTELEELFAGDTGLQVATLEAEDSEVTVRADGASERGASERASSESHEDRRSEDSWEQISAKYADKLAQEDDEAEPESKESPESILDRVSHLFEEEDGLGVDAAPESVTEESSLITSDQTLPSDLEKLVRRLELHVDSVVAGLEQRIEKLLGSSAGSIAAPLSVDSAVDVSADQDESAGELDEESGWEATKRSMMTKYGEVPGVGEGEEAGSDVSDAGLDEDAVSITESESDGEAQSDEESKSDGEVKEEKDDSASSFDSGLTAVMSAEDADSIQKLKDQLTSQLREAEIELSISRAKMSQRKAKLDQMQSDIERREKEMADGLREGAGKSAGRSRLLNRWLNSRK